MKNKIKITNVEITETKITYTVRYRRRSYENVITVYYHRPKNCVARYFRLRRQITKMSHYKSKGGTK